MTEKINRIVETAKFVKPEIINEKIEFDPPISTQELNAIIKSHWN